MCIENNSKSFFPRWYKWEFVLNLHKTEDKKILTMSVDWKMAMGYWYDATLMQFCNALVHLGETGNTALCKALTRPNLEHSVVPVTCVQERLT